LTIEELATVLQMARERERVGIASCVVLFDTKDGIISQPSKLDSLDEVTLPFKAEVCEL
jgi:hypothetical protein